MRLSAEASSQRPAIERMIRMVRDDGAVMAYFGISRHEVETIRAELPQSEKRRYMTDRALDCVNVDVKNDAVLSAAAMGSNRLREAIELLFRKWERDNDMRPGAGVVLLPAGWSEQRGRAA